MPETPSETSLRQRLVRVALRQEPADLVIRGAQIVSVTTRELLSGDVAIADGYVAAGGTGLPGRRGVRRRRQVPLAGLHRRAYSHRVEPADPGQLRPRRAATRHGPGWWPKPHEIVNVLGEAGLRWMLEAGQNSGLRVWASQPSCVPASMFEQGGARLEPTDIGHGLTVPGVLGLAEMMNYPGVLNHDAAVWATLEAARGKRIDGHAAGLSGEALQAYAAAGIHSDHEAMTQAEAHERLRAGTVADGARGIGSAQPGRADAGASYPAAPRPARQ